MVLMDQSLTVTVKQAEVVANWRKIGVFFDDVIVPTRRFSGMNVDSEPPFTAPVWEHFFKSHMKERSRLV